MLTIFFIDILNFNTVLY